MKTKLHCFLVLFLALLMQISFAQERVVSGTVTDNSGLPIPGVNVLVKGTNTGVQTDFDGKYSIKASPNQILVFNFVGMKSQEIAASSVTINVKMQDEAVELEGVVVTALGVKRQQKSLGYATTTVSAKDLTTVNNTTVFESLSGKVAGVDVTAPAQPGASSKVVIRGFNTFGDASPLYVIDGTPVNNLSSNSLIYNTATGTQVTRSFDSGNGINDIDPNNIESMTVLKGAAASALYGSRAANGVIIITTKSGKNKSKVTVEVSTSADASQVARVPHFQNTFGQGWNGLSYSVYQGQNQQGNNASNENGSWGPKFNGEIRPWGNIYNNSQQIKPYVVLEDNMKDFYATGTTFTNNVRISGGGENSNFAMNFTDVNSDGVIPTDADAYKRKTFGINGGFGNKKFSFKGSANYVKKDQSAVNTGQGDDAGQGATFMQEFLQIPRDLSIVDMADYKNNVFNSNDYFYTPYAQNPYWTLNENSTKIDGNRFYGNANLEYKFTDELSMSYQIGGDYQMEKVKSYGAIVNFTEGSPQDEAGTIETVGGVTEASNEFVQFDSNLILNYNTKINENFNLNSFIGVGQNERKVSTLQAEITNLDIPFFYELTNSSVKPQVIQDNSIRRTSSVYGSFETSYKDRVYLTLTGRNDWSSTLPQGNNSYFYPSASLSGVVANTNDFFLKLRASYAKIANDTQAYQTENALGQAISSLGFGNIYLPIGGVNGYENIRNLGNPNLKPEITKEYEVGFETSVLNKRINMDFAYYNKTTDGLIVSLPLPTSTGYASVRENAVDLRNQGVEIMLNLIPIKTDNFQWDFNTTFTKNISKVLDVIGDTPKIQLAQTYAISFNAEVGEPLGTFGTFVPLREGYQYMNNKLDENGIEIPESGDFVNGKGSIIVNENTGRYEVTPQEQNIGNIQRDFVMGFVNKFKYKNISMYFGVDWKQGGKMYSYTKQLSNFTGNSIASTYNDRNPFIVPNSVNEITDSNGVKTYQENTTAIPFEQVSDFYSNGRHPGIEYTHVIDKTFVRLRDIAITYDLPSKLIKNTGISAVSFTLYGKNLALWTPGDNSYVDPELSTFGTGLLSEQGEFATNPSQRSFGGTLKLTF